MAFNFRDLTERTRTLMADEVDWDVNQGKLYLSSRLTAAGKTQWVNLLRGAIDGGSDATLGAALGAPGGVFIEAQEPDVRNGGLKAVPYNAAETLSESEFNRYYIRALCVSVIEDGGELVIYRARASANPDAQSEKIIGNTVDALDLQNDLRSNQGVATALGLPPHPNSGLSVFIRNIP